MKWILVLILATFPLDAAVIWTSPAHPTEIDDITVYFDPSQATRQELTGNGQVIYTHTGVHTNVRNWDHVIGSWGINSTQPQLNYDGDGIYSLHIGNVRDFYSVPDNESISEFCFELRNSMSDRQSEDLFTPLYEPGLSLALLSPVMDSGRKWVFLDMGDTLKLQAIAIRQGGALDQFSLYQDDVLLTETQSDTLSYTITQLPAAGQILHYRFVASTSGGYRDTLDLSAIVNPDSPNLPPPPGTRPGWTIDGNSVTLALFAPRKEFVYLIGDFNDWNADPAYFMNRYTNGADSTLFWITLDGLSKDTEYGYQYLVDGNIRIADPYAEKVLDPWDDKYITESEYPGLKPYPEGKTTEICSVLNLPSQEFAWTDSGYHSPDQRGLVIYELLMRDFTAAHDYRTLTDSLDYLKNLGINAIELMPVNEFEGNDSWGYNPSFYFAPDKYYGPAEDLKKMVDAAHARGIAVIIDLVLNHSYFQSPLVRLYNGGGYTGPVAGNPWYNVTTPHTDYSWGADFNHQSIHTQYFVDRVTSWWIREFHMDGYRFDFTRGFTNHAGTSGAYDQSRIDILERMAGHIWSVKADAYVILEHLIDDNYEMKTLANDGMMLWGNSNYNYCEAAMGWINSSDFSWGYFKTRGWAKPNLVTYMESHDEERAMYKALTFGNASANYSTQNLSTALDRIKLNAAFFIPLPGPKMLWQFEELGYDISIDTNGRTGRKPLHWEYFQDSSRLKLYRSFASLIHLRNQYTAFRDGNSSVTLNASGAVKTISVSGDINAQIVGNFDVLPHTATVNFVHSGNWYNYSDGVAFSIDGSSRDFTLAPGRFLILTDRVVDNPWPLAFTNVDDGRGADVPDEFHLAAPWPNPFNSTVHIALHLPGSDTEPLRIRIYDICGQEVTQLMNADQQGGDAEFTWDGLDNSGNRVASGVYLIRSEWAGQKAVRKIILLK